MKNKQNTYLLPHGWSWIRLSDITLPVQKVSRNIKDSKSKFIYIDINAIDNTTQTIGITKKYSWNEAPSRAQQVIETNDILFATVRPYLKNIALVTGEFNNEIASSAFCVIRTRLINYKYIFYYVTSESFIKSIGELAKGTSYPAVTSRIVLDQLVPLPPVAEQHKIVTQLDEKISRIRKSEEQVKTCLEELKIYRLSILQSAFSGKLSMNWRKSQDVHQDTTDLVNQVNEYYAKEYQDSMEGFNSGKLKNKPKGQKKINSEPKSAQVKSELPEGWIYIRLGDVCKDTDRVNRKETDASKGFKYLDIGGINSHKNTIQNHKHFTWKDAPSRAQHIVQKDDILFSTVRTYKKNIAMVDDEFSGQIASSGFTVIRTIPEIINATYLFRYVLSDEFTQALNLLQTGSSYPAVRDKDVFDQLIPICAMAEQEYISRELEKKYSVIENLEKTLEEILNESKTLIQKIQQKAFEGTLVEHEESSESVSDVLFAIKKLQKERKENLDKKRNEVIIEKKMKSSKTPKLSLIDTIKERFAQKEFTFIQLTEIVEMNYDDLREDIFLLLDNGKDLSMSYDVEQKVMKFKCNR
jgi:type I restriction enzyme S subunit